MGRRKKERNEPGLGLKRPPLAQPMQQPTKNSTSNGAGIFDKVLPRWNVGEGRLPVVFDSNSSDKKYNEKIHSVAVDGHQTMKRHMTTNQKTVSVMGGGVMTRCDHGGTYGGEDFMSFGAVNNATKN